MRPANLFLCALFLILACENYHPGLETHALMADKSIQFLSAELGW